MCLQALPFIRSAPVILASLLPTSYDDNLGLFDPDHPPAGVRLAVHVRRADLDQVRPARELVREQTPPDVVGLLNLRQLAAGRRRVVFLGLLEGGVGGVFALDPLQPDPLAFPEPHLDGRSLRAGEDVDQHFGLGRSKIREMAFAGEIPGIVKASW